MSNNEKRRFTKHVAIKTIDEEEQTATGIVLTPYELDHQLDFVYPDGVQAMYNPAPEDGVLHAAFPEDAAELEFNEVLEEDQEIDGEEFEEGDWVVRRKYHDDELWSFVGEVLHGFSIGGDVSKADEFESIDDLPDEVEIPDSVDPDAVDDEHWPPAGIRNGATSEISDVDIPAVTSAMYATKGRDLEKNLYESAEDRDDFVDRMTRRGAPEEGAGGLYDYLDQLEKTAPDGAVTKFFADAEKFDFDSCVESVMEDGHTQEEAEEICGAQYHDTKMEHSNTPDEEPDDATKWQMFKSWLAGTGGPFDAAESDDGVSPAEGQSEVSAGTFSKAIDVARDVTKEGRTLNATNREALMAGHDAIEMALESDVDFETNRFTDDDSTEFDIVQYGSSGESDDETEKSRPVEKLTEEQGELVLAAIQRFVDNQGEAAFSEFRSWVWSTDILDDDTAFAADEAAYQYREWDREQREQTSVTEDFLDWVQDESDTDTEITMSKDDNTDSETDKAMEDAPEWGQAIYEEQQKNSDRIDELSKAIDDEGDADGGETSESDGDSSGDGEGETSKSADGETAPEWVQPIQDGIEKNAENIQAVAQASGHSQQLDYDGEAGTEKNADEEPDDGEVKKAFLGL